MQERGETVKKKVIFLSCWSAEHAILSGTEHQRKGKFTGPKNPGCIKLWMLVICPCKAFGHQITGDMKILKCVHWFQGKSTEKCQYAVLSVSTDVAWWHWSSNSLCVLAEEPNPKPLSWDSLGGWQPRGFVCILCFFLPVYMFLFYLQLKRSSWINSVLNWK